MDVSERLILATDELTPEQTVDFVRHFGSRFYAIKIHNHFDQDSRFAETLSAAGARRVWVDAKLHDVPNTVRLRAAAIAEYADILTVHAAGGIKMMEEAVMNGPREIYAITVLTSISEAQGEDLFGRSNQEMVYHLAEQAKEAGVTGVVCSAQEVRFLSLTPALQGLKFITPGIRMPDAAGDDQKRVGSPKQAILDGATHLVIGRPITLVANPEAALVRFENEIAAALEELASLRYYELAEQ